MANPFELPSQTAKAVPVAAAAVPIVVVEPPSLETALDVLANVGRETLQLIHGKAGHVGHAYLSRVEIVVADLLFALQQER
jgi:hypothetical protein